MEGRTITRADLSESVFQEVGLSRNESSDLVETILAEVVEALARGESVKISSFGSFTVRDKGQRVGLEFLTPAPHFWGVDFVPTDWPAPAAARPI